MQSILKEIVLSNVIVNNKSFELYEKVVSLRTKDKQQLFNCMERLISLNKFAYSIRNATKESQLEMIYITPYCIIFIKNPSNKLKMASDITRRQREYNEAL